MIALAFQVFSQKKNRCFFATSDQGSGFFDANGAVWDRNTYCLRFDDAILEGYESQIAPGNNGNISYCFFAVSAMCSSCCEVKSWQDMFHESFLTISQIEVKKAPKKV